MGDQLFFVCWRKVTRGGLFCPIISDSHEKLHKVIMNYINHNAKCK
jgi:hypothetical protein